MRAALDVCFNCIRHGFLPPLRIVLFVVTFVLSVVVVATMRKQEPLPPVQLICLDVMFGLACIAIQQRGHSLKLGRLGGRLGLPLSPVAALVPVDATGREPASSYEPKPPNLEDVLCAEVAVRSERRSATCTGAVHPTFRDCFSVTRRSCQQISA